MSIINTAMKRIIKLAGSPKLLSSWRRMLLGTASKALLKSKYTESILTSVLTEEAT
jgi:hypothetical protein